MQLPVINKKRHGNGIADIIPSITNFIGNNKEFINNVSNVAKAAGSVTDASAKVTQAVKAAKELNQLNQLKEIRKNNKSKPKKKDQSEISKILDEHNLKKIDPKGDGFQSFHTTSRMTESDSAN